VVIDVNRKEPGRIVITLDEYRKSREISKNKIVLGAGIQRTQLQNYCRNKVARVDLGVLARICHYLDCELSDIMRYEAESKEE
jgi:putative transcriptional regulator